MYADGERDDQLSVILFNFITSMHTDTVIRPMVWVRQPRHEEDKGPDKVPQLITDLAEFKYIHPDPEPGPVASWLPVGAGEGQHRAHTLRGSR